MQVLILEDNLILQRQMIDWVESLGHKGFGVVCATEAFGFLRNVAVDAIIADLFVKRDGHYVPDGGVLLIGRVRTANNGMRVPSDVPILALSDGGDLKGIQHAFQLATNLGADMVLPKPVDTSEVAIWLAEVKADLPVHELEP